MTPPEPWWIAPAIIATVITVTAGLITLAVNGRRARTDRQRQVFAAAFGDIAAYCEYPYIVRRRRHGQPEEEQIRISTTFSEVQSRLNQHQAVLRVEAPRVAWAYTALVQATKDVAGASVREGWDIPTIPGGSPHVRNVDLSALETHKDRYLTAVADHLSYWPWWAQAAGRSLVRHLPGRHHRDVAAPTALPVPAPDEQAA